MAITRGTAVAANSGGLGTGFTIASVNCSGTDRYLMVTVAMSDTSKSVTSVTFNGSESLTFASGRNGGTVSREEVWVLTAPSAVTANVVVVTSSTVSCGIALPYAGVDQTTPREGSVASGGTSTAPALAGTLTWGGGADELAMSVVWKDTGITFTPDAGVTSVASTTSGSGASHVGLHLLADYDTETGKVAGALGSSTGWGVIGANLNAAAGGSSIAAISAGYHNQGLR